MCCRSTWAFTNQILDEFPEESVQPQVALIIMRMRAAPASVAIKGGEVPLPSRQRVERPICDPKLIQIIQGPRGCRGTMIL